MKRISDDNFSPTQYNRELYDAINRGGFDFPGIEMADIYLKGAQAQLEADQQVLKALFDDVEECLNGTIGALKLELALNGVVCNMSISDKFESLKKKYLG